MGGTYTKLDLRTNKRLMAVNRPYGVTKLYSNNQNDIKEKAPRKVKCLCVPSFGNNEGGDGLRHQDQQMAPRHNNK